MFASLSTKGGPRLARWLQIVESDELSEASGDHNHARKT
jgi:hypothetical protein